VTDQIEENLGRKDANTCAVAVAPNIVAAVAEVSHKLVVASPIFVPVVDRVKAAAAAVVVAAGLNDIAIVDEDPVAVLTVSLMDLDHLNDPLFTRLFCFESNVQCR
jgi:hypothetical protein